MVLVLIGKQWLTVQDDYGRRRIDISTDWVRREVEEALTIEGRVVPVLVDEATTVPAEALDDLPNMVKLASCQAAKRRTQEWDSDFNALVTLLTSKGLTVLTQGDSGQNVDRARQKDAQRDVDTVLQRHAAHWKKLLGSQTPATNEGSPRSPLAGLQRRLRDLRLDRYVWSGLAWEDPTRTDEHGRPVRTQLSGQDREPALTVLSTLLDAKNAKNIVLYDDAGMGKTAFTLKLIELLIDSAAKLPELLGKLPLVVRLEGEWLRDSKGAPRTIAASLEELIARSLRYEDATVDDSLIASAVSAAMNDGRVFIIVDAFDQMTEEERKHVASLLNGDAHEQIDRDYAAQCAWLITGRPYALRMYQTELEELGAMRLRLTGLSREQQDRYFEDYEADPFFQQRQTKPLDWVCVARDEIEEDLAIPFHLREIRRLIEVDTGREEGVRRISSTGELHGMVARALLQRAVKHYANEPVPTDARRPDDKHEQLDLLLRVCGLLAFQMMLEGRIAPSLPTFRSTPDSKSQWICVIPARFLPLSPLRGEGVGG